MHEYAYPLLFRISHQVRCGQFAGALVTDGRVLIVFDDGEWWCNGVEPGGLTESGRTPLAAFASFKRAYQSALDDLAEECQGVDDFSGDVRSLFHGDAAEAERWKRALVTVRDDTAIDEEVSRLPRLPVRDSKISFEFVENQVGSEDQPEVALPVAA